MDSYENLEVYIPKEAEVESIPLARLPEGLRRQMGLRTEPGGSGSGGSPEEGTYVSPVVFRTKGGGRTDGKDSVAVRRKRGTTQIRKPAVSFVSSNREAFRVLEDLGRKTSSGRASTAAATATATGPSLAPPVLPRGSTYHTDRDAVVICNGRVYLTLRKPEPVRRGLRPRLPACSGRSVADDVVSASPAMEIASVSFSDSQEEALMSPEPSNSQEETLMSPEPSKGPLQEEEEEERLLTWRCLHTKLHVRLARIPQEKIIGSGGHA